MGDLAPDKLIYLHRLQVAVLEVEMKFRSPDNDEVEAALRRLGARKLSEETIEDIYYSRQGTDFAASDEALRLRKHMGAAELTYKGPRINASTAKAREELSVSLDDGLSATRILERLGFEELLTVRKRRAAYRLDALRIDVDEVEGLGQFVELEILTDDVAEAEKLLDSMRESLPLGEKVNKTYLEMLMDGHV